MTVQQPQPSTPLPDVPDLGTQLNEGGIDLPGNTRIFLSKDGIFNTIQGEGPRLGRLTTFMRLAGCNLACSWCDTAYTWDWTGKNGHKYYPTDESIGTLLDTVLQELIEKVSHTKSLTITGGEPLLQWHVLDKLFEHLIWMGVPLNEINFETNGTIYPKWSRFTGIINYVVSPKLTNSGQKLPQDTPEGCHTLAKFVGNPFSEFKFVCKTVADLDEIDALCKQLVLWEGAYLAPERIWIMPEGVNPGVVNNRARELVDAVIARGWNLTTRFHMQLWGHERAR